ncbi:unnamed protein product [Heterobilharzia americana]|nr:unnamed protein product [Heterobilharzia americana]
MTSKPSTYIWFRILLETSNLCLPCTYLANASYYEPHVCLSGLFAMSDLFCNAVDVKNSTGVKNNNDNHSTSNPNSELLNNITFGNYNDDNFIRSQSGVKKPRLSEKLISLATPTNGFKDAYGTYGPDSLPEIHEETKEIRLCFNSELKQALEDKLTKYLTFIQAIEKKRII